MKSENSCYLTLCVPIQRDPTLIHGQDAKLPDIWSGIKSLGQPGVPSARLMEGERDFHMSRKCDAGSTRLSAVLGVSAVLGDAVGHPRRRQRGTPSIPIERPCLAP